MERSNDLVRLCFTGMGCVTPLGNTVESYWSRLLQGACGVGQITRFDASKLPVQIAAEVKDFVAEDFLTHAEIRSSSLFMQFALVAAREALRQHTFSDPSRVGIVFATAMGGISPISDTAKLYLQSKTKRVSPHFVPAVISNMAAAHVAIHYGFQGPALTVQTACASGNDAILTAALLLKAHICDAVLILGGESIVCDVAISSLAQAKALSRLNSDPIHASRPFDAKRDGFVLGEGGGALVLERLDSVRARGGEILAELVGYANSIDTYHVTAPEPNGLGAASCMRKALSMANITPQA
ncbi:MAG: beta-ketoacyl-[Desulfovibrio sp.]|nr:beta-ketoacyl-[acyl-carrier-protein] synthase II [Desulfovibrio sp.]